MKNNKKNVLFIYPALENDSLAIEYLSSYIKKEGHKTSLILNASEHVTCNPKLVEHFFEKRLYNRIDNFKPDFIAFSVMTEDYKWACNIAELIKKKYGLPIIMGGIHITSAPETAIKNKFIDYIILGEGEEAFLELIENPSKTSIKNVWSKKNGKIYRNNVRPLIKDLNKLPFPDRGLFHKEAPYLYDIYHCEAGRGCPFSCSYCFNSYMGRLYKGKGNWLRTRSVDNVINELKVMKRKYNYKQVLFVDDCFVHNIVWLREFTQKYKLHIGVPYRVQGNSVFLTKEVLSMLKDSGCLRVQIGAQTPIERLRKEIYNRNESNEVIEKAVAEAKRQGFFVQLDHISGFPTENKYIKEFKKAVEFYIKLKPHSYQLLILQYFPNTDIVKKGLKSGAIDEEFMKKTEEGEVLYKFLDWKKVNPELIQIRKFLWWTTILPRSLSLWLLRSGNYKKIFKKDWRKIPYLLPFLKSPSLIISGINAYRRRTKMETFWQKMDKNWENK